MTPVLNSSPDRALTSAEPTSLPAESLVNKLSKLGKGPLSFWFLNHHLEKPELARQLRELKAKGFSGVFLHPRGGLLEPYGSQHWYEAVGFCIDEARKLGLEAWLYDEDPYPSGAAGGRVILEDPSLRASCLEPCWIEVREPGRKTLDLPAGALIGAYLVQGENITSIDHLAGIVRTDWTQYYTSSSYHPVYLDSGVSHWRASTDAPHYRVVIDVSDVSVPTYLIGFVRQYVSQNPWGAYPDLLNPKSVEAFTTYTHQEYADQFGESFGNVVPGIFTDESKLRGFLPWSGNVPSLFEKVCGHDLRKVLPHLVFNLSPATPYIRWAYREALAQGFLKNFVKPLQECCLSLNLLFTGHISPEEAPLSQAVIAPGLMRALAAMDIPGTDFIAHTMGGAFHPLLHISPKLASSAAHATSKPLVACEAFAVSDWAQDLNFLTRVTNWLFALGVNRIITHGQFYSIDGLRKREAPPSQFFQASYWEHFHAYSETVTFLTDQLTQGRHEAPLLVYYPEEAFMVHSFHENGHVAPEGEKLEKRFGELLRSLLVSGFDFDLADASILSTATPCDGSLLLGEELFQAVVVPGCHLCESSWNLLDDLRQQGIPIYFTESEITILSSPLSHVQVRGYGFPELVARLAESITPLWKCQDAELLGHKRSTENGPLLFLCNNSEQKLSREIELDFPGPYEICFPTRGLTWTYTGENLLIDLSPGEGGIIRQASRTSPPAYITENQWRPLQVEWDDWSAEALSDNCLVLHQFRVLSRPQSASRPLPSFDHYSMAPIIDLLSPTLLHIQPPPAKEDRFLRTDFEWHGPSKHVRLVHDSELSLAVSSDGEAPIELLINDCPVGPSIQHRTYDPMNREVDITSLVREGRNSLTLIQKGGDTTFLPWPYDAVRIYGRFHVEFPYGNHPPARLTDRPLTYPCDGPISPALLGHPHYGGIFCYRAAFQIATVPKRLCLRFRKVHETMSVSVNGHDCGVLWTPPYLIEIDAAFLVPGRNELILSCATSPANYLQVMNRPAGALGPIEWCEA